MLRIIFSFKLASILKHKILFISENTRSFAKLFLKFALCAFLMSSLINCSSPQKVVSRNFDPKTKIQVIEVASSYYVYAQNDQVLNGTLTTELTQMNPEWSKEFSKNRRINIFQETAFLLQVASLFACISGAANDDGKIMDVAYGAFCGASVGFGLLSFKLDKTMRKNTHKVITEYNSRY